MSACLLREVAERFPELRPGIVNRLVGSFSEIKSGKVFRGALWVVGEYSLGIEGMVMFGWLLKIKEILVLTYLHNIEMEATWKAIHQNLGEIPIAASEQVCIWRFFLSNKSRDSVLIPSATRPRSIVKTPLLKKRHLQQGDIP